MGDTGSFSTDADGLGKSPSGSPSGWLRRTLLALLTLSSLTVVAAWAQGPASSGEAVTVALVSDGPSRQAWDLEALFRQELVDLTRGELELRFEPFSGDWSRRGLNQALERAYADPEVDLVFVTGLVANQIFGLRSEYPKPTFLPLVADPGLLGLPRSGEVSGKDNLTYLADDVGFAADLEALLELVPVSRLGLLADAIVLDAVGRIRQEAVRLAAEAGVELVPVPYSDPRGDLLARVPEGVDALMVDGLARLEEPAVDRLIADINRRGLPSYSLMGSDLVHRGMLVSGFREAEARRIARRAALAVQAVLLGEPAAAQPVTFDTERRLIVNLSTAREIDVWPSYRTLVEAQLLGGDIGEGAPTLSLTEAAAEALRVNLDLLVETFGVDAGAEDIREARARFLPQLSAGLTASRLDDGGLAVISGAAAERSFSGGLTLQQLVFSESARANLDIQRSLQQGREAELEAFRLDTVQAATVAFLNILRAETAFRIQRDNLERTRTNLKLAQDRVRVGSASAADTYRWESELASTRQAAIRSHAERMTARENLNRVLHRPLTDPADLVPPSLDDGQVFQSSSELEALVDDPAGFRILTELLVEEGLGRAPELRTLDTAIDAKARELLAARRAFYLPDVAFQAQIDQVLEEERLAGVSQEGERDWSLGLSASLALFEGGARNARVSRAELELRQLKARRDAAQEAIEQGIRASLHLANASYNSIELAREGAEAARKNLDLVADAYAEGAVGILELLDAQSAALQAEGAASNAVYDFLIDFMNVSRSVGRFDLLLDAEERREILAELLTRIRERHGDER
ncbi:MAG: TolC family protein [Holophagales bacterium]|nr:TolC family protein [Holophagales bacterium]